MNELRWTHASTRTTSRGRASWLVVVLLVAAFVAACACAWWLGRRSGANTTSTTSTTSTSAATPTDAAAASLWTCGMHPNVIQDAPGTCPICHMDLTPLAGAAQSGGLTIDPVIVQNMGLRTAPVELRSSSRKVRATAEVMEREGDHLDVTARVAGYVAKLHATTDGMPVVRGEPLFELDSPTLRLAIDELITARRALDDARGADGARVRDDDERASLPHALRAAARAKLLVLGMTREQVDAFEALDVAPALVTYLSPIDGHVTARDVEAGGAVDAGSRVLRLATNAVVWIDARVPESELAHVALGAALRARVTAAPGEVFEGVVTFVHPHVDRATRTALVRGELANPRGTLREGMSATVEIDGVAGALLPTVPREAVIDSGLRRIAFVALGEGRFEARDVVVTAYDDEGRASIASGLASGEMVVVSGQFLLDAESRIREAVRRHLERGLPHATPPEDTQATAPAAAGERAEEREAPQASVDAVFAAYLALATRMGAAEDASDPLDAGTLARTAHELAASARGATQRLADELAQAATRIEKAPRDERRDLFAPVSEIAIALADRSPPSAAAAPHLFVVHCPMAPGSWLQTHEDVENPYYATRMKACGEVVRAIPVAAADGAPTPTEEPR